MTDIEIPNCWLYYRGDTKTLLILSNIKIILYFDFVCRKFHFNIKKLNLSISTYMYIHVNLWNKEIADENLFDVAYYIRNLCHPVLLITVLNYFLYSSTYYSAISEYSNLKFSKPFMPHLACFCVPAISSSESGIDGNCFLPSFEPSFVLLTSEWVDSSVCKNHKICKYEIIYI